MEQNEKIKKFNFRIPLIYFLPKNEIPEKYLVT